MVFVTPISGGNVIRPFVGKMSLIRLVTAKSSSRNIRAISGDGFNEMDFLNTKCKNAICECYERAKVLARDVVGDGSHQLSNIQYFMKRTRKTVN